MISTLPVAGQKILRHACAVRGIHRTHGSICARLRPQNLKSGNPSEGGSAHPAEVREVLLRLSSAFPTRRFRKPNSVNMVRTEALMCVRTLAIAAALGLLGIPGLANPVPAAPSVAQLGSMQQADFLLVRGGPGPWPGPHWGPGPWAGPPWGPGPWPGPPWRPGPGPRLAWRSRSVPQPVGARSVCRPTLGSWSLACPALRPRLRSFRVWHLPPAEVRALPAIVDEPERPTSATPPTRRSLSSDPRRHSAF